VHVGGTSQAPRKCYKQGRPVLLWVHTSAAVISPPPQSQEPVPDCSVAPRPTQVLVPVWRFVFSWKVTLQVRFVVCFHRILLLRHFSPPYSIPVVSEVCWNNLQIDLKYYNTKDFTREPLNVPAVARQDGRFGKAFLQEPRGAQIPFLEGCSEVQKPSTSSDFAHSPIRLSLCSQYSLHLPEFSAMNLWKYLHSFQLL